MRKRSKGNVWSDLSVGLVRGKVSGFREESHARPQIVMNQSPTTPNILAPVPPITFAWSSSERSFKYERTHSRYAQYDSPVDPASNPPPYISRSGPNRFTSSRTTGPTSLRGYWSFRGGQESFITTLGNLTHRSTTSYSSGVPWNGLPRWSTRTVMWGNSRIRGSKPGAYRGSK